jgi:porin
MTIFLDGLEIQGTQPSALSGDAQGVSNIAGPPGFRPYEAWLQFNFLGARMSALGGLYDLNSEFYRLQSAGLFLNSSFGTGPEFAQSGVEGPSIFPNTSVGARLAFKPTPNIVLRTAMLDGVPLERPGGSSGVFERGDGLLLVTEAAFLNRPAPDNEPISPRFRIGRASGLQPYDDKFAIGSWYYTAKFSDLSEVAPNGLPAQHRGSGGFYLIGDRLLFQAKDNPVKRVTAFLQAGIGDGRVNRFGSYIGLGLAATGFIAGRPSDQMGLAVAAARNGKHYDELQEQLGSAVTRSEIALELTYLSQIADWLALQPDVQYVTHPNTNPSLKNALVFQFQLEMSF